MTSTSSNLPRHPLSTTSSSGRRMRFTRILAGFAAVVIASTGLALGVSAPASAAPVSTEIQGITFSADDSNPDAGATVTHYDSGYGLSVTIPSTVQIGATTYDVTAVEDDVFGSMGLSAVSIPDTVTSIGSYAFADENFQSIAIPDSVTDVSVGAFQDDPSVTSLTLGNGLTTIEPYAFYGLSMTSVVIPPSVTEIDDNAFDDDPALATVTFIGTAPIAIGTATSDSPFGPANPGPTVQYYEPFGADQNPGGFTSPWQGYATARLTGTAPGYVTVRYQMDGHGDQLPSTATAIGYSPTPPGDDFTPGLSLNEWYTSPSLTTAFDFTQPITTDTTLYAGWSVAPAGRPLPSTEAMYTIACDSSLPEGQLLKEEPSDGTSARIGSGSTLAGCGYLGEWDPVNSTAYIESQAANDPFAIINVHTGITTAGFQPMLNGTKVGLDNLAISSNGVMYAAQSASGDPHLYSVDTTSGDMTQVMSTGGANLYLLTADPTTGLLYGLSENGSTIYSIDPIARTLTTLRSSLGLDLPTGFYFVALQTDASGQIWVEATNGASSDVWSIDPSNNYAITPRWQLTANGSSFNAVSLIIAPAVLPQLATTGVAINPATIPTVLVGLGIGAVLIVISRRRIRVVQRKRR